MSFEEGDKCKDKSCDGVYEYGDVENCSCHINPPCGQCTNISLTCSECKYEHNEIEDYKE